MASSYLTRQTTVPTSEKTFTFSTWMKVSARTGADNGIIEWYRDSNNRHQILIDSTSSKLRVYSVEAGSSKVDVHSNAVFRDPSAWYHIVIHSDNTQASASDRFKLWVNGVAQTFSTYTWSFNQGVNINVYDGTSGDAVNLGTRNESTSNSFDGCLADTYYIDGSTIAHTEFGQTDSTSGIWKPNMSPTISSYGNAGFHLTYEDSSNIGDDTSGNSKDMTSVGTLTQNKDTPSNNFATLNPLHTTGNSTLPALSNGNLTYTGHSSTSYSGTYSSIAASSGKWYAEFKCTGGAGAVDMMIGAGTGITNTTAPGASSEDMVVFGYDGKYYAGSSGVSYGDAWVSGDIIGIAMDLDNNKMYIRKNDSAWMNSGDPTSGSTGTGALTLATSSTGVYHFLLGDYGGSGTPICEANFGSGFFGTTAVASANADGNGIGAFEYAVPSGYYALNTKNLKEFG